MVQFCCWPLRLWHVVALEDQRVNEKTKGLGRLVCLFQGLVRDVRETAKSVDCHCKHVKLVMGLVSILIILDPSHVSVSCGLSQRLIPPDGQLPAGGCVPLRQTESDPTSSLARDQLSPLQSFLSSQKIKPGTVRIFTCRGHSPSSCFLSTSAKPHRMHIIFSGNRKAESIRKRSANLSLQLSPISRIVNKKGLCRVKYCHQTIPNTFPMKDSNILPTFCPCLQLCTRKEDTLTLVGIEA